MPTIFLGALRLPLETPDLTVIDYGHLVIEANPLRLDLTARDVTIIDYGHLLIEATPLRVDLFPRGVTVIDYGHLVIDADPLRVDLIAREMHVINYGHLVIDADPLRFDLDAPDPTVINYGHLMIYVDPVRIYLDAPDPTVINYGHLVIDADPVRVDLTARGVTVIDYGHLVIDADPLDVELDLPAVTFTFAAQFVALDSPPHLTLARPPVSAFHGSSSHRLYLITPLRLRSEAPALTLLLIPRAPPVDDQLNTSVEKTIDAENSLPADESWDEAKAHIEQAQFYLTNSDEDAGPLGAVPLHTQVVTQESAASAAVHAAALLMVPGSEGAKKEIKEAVKALQDANTAERIANMTLHQLNLEYAQIDKRVAELDGVEKKKRVQLWCADYTTDLKDKSNLGTAEVPDEYGKLGAVVIKPAFVEGEREWKYPRDGHMTPIQAMSASGYFYNRAMLPPAQLYRPQYRFAKIIKFNDDNTVNVDIIDPYVSSQQALDVLPKPIPEDLTEEEKPATKSLENVKVKYMDCDVAAFLDDDEVLVWFEEFDQTKPKVVGFKKNPRPCKGVMVLNTEGHQLRGQEAKPPNPKQWSHNPNATDKGFGNMGWVGDEIGLSWMGYRGRYFEMDHSGLDVDRYKFEAKLWHKGKVFDTPDTCLGAGIIEKRIFVAVIQPKDTTNCELWFRNIRGGSWTYATTWAHPGLGGSIVHRPYFFSKSALKCVGGLFGCIRKMITLALTLTGDIVTAAVTIPEDFTFPENENLIPPSSSNTCDDETSPCEVHSASHTEQRYMVGADYVGEDLVTLWRADRLYNTTDNVYGAAITECQFVGPYPRVSVALSNVVIEEQFIRCPELDYERRIYRKYLTGSSSSTSTVFPLPDTEPPDVTCCVRTNGSGSQTTTYDFTSLEYLNVSEGTEKIVEVYNDVQATESRSSISHTGCPQLEMEQIETVAGGIAGMETITLAVHGTVKPLAQWFFTLDTEITPTTPEQLRAVRVLNGATTPEGNTANAGEGFVAHSAKLFEKTDALPAVPDAFMDGNTDRYLDHGIG